MRAIVLAAGRGSRLGALTERCPKCMVPLAGQPLLHWQLRSLRAAGIHEIAVVTGYCAEALRPFQLAEFHNADWSRTNMVRSLLCAAEWLRAAPCLVAYSDIFYSPDIVRLLTDTSQPLAITYDPRWLELWSRRFSDPLADAESFQLHADGFIRDIGRKVTSLAEIQGQYMGLLRFIPESWLDVERFLATKTDDQLDRLDMTSLLRGLIESGRPVFGIPIQSPWGEADCESDLQLYEQMLAQGQLTL